MSMITALGLIAQSAPGEERSALVTVLLVGLGAAAGVIVGVLPALTAALLLGYLPPPWRARRPAGMLVEPAAERRAVRDVAPALTSAPPEPVALAVPRAPSPRERALETPPAGRLAVLAHARHQAVYDAAYAEQLDRVESLRSAIGGRRSKSSEPPAE